MSYAKAPKLIIIDCDGVLYDENELDTNALVHGFNKTCSEYFKFPDKNVDAVASYAKEKHTKGAYTYINEISKKIGIDPESLVKQVIENIDYSNIKSDKDNILPKLQELQHKYKICIYSNNHLMHVNKILKAKFNTLANQLPFEVFDMRYAEQDGIFYAKESDVSISKLEKHFNINAKDFLWIDDSQHISDALEPFGCRVTLVTKENRLIDILNKL
jgi:phosphoglycolate phosphatase-like HAD superfamily hydrolase